jgi:hypothetical protein
MAPHGAGTAASRSDQGVAAPGAGGAGARPRGGDLQVREGLPDDRRIVQGADQALPAPTVRTRQDVHGKGTLLILHLPQWM